MSILDLLKPKKTSVLDLLEEKPTFAEKVSKGVMGAAASSFIPRRKQMGEALIKGLQEIMPLEEWEEFGKKEIKNVPTLQEFIQASKAVARPALFKMPAEEEGKALLKTVSYPLRQISRPVEALRAGAGAMIDRKPILESSKEAIKGFLKPEEVPTLVSKIPFQKWEQGKAYKLIPRSAAEAVETVVLYHAAYGGALKNIKQSIKTSTQKEGIAKIERTLPSWEKQVKFPKDMSNKDRVITILRAAQTNREVGDLVNNILSQPSKMYTGGIPAKQLAELAKQFKLSTAQVASISKGIYTGLSGEVVKAIKKIKPEVIKPTLPIAPKLPEIAPKLPITAPKAGEGIPSKGGEQFIRLATKAETTSQATKNKAFSSFPKIEGQQVVYKPYGEQGKGFYYAPESRVDMEPAPSKGGEIEVYHGTMADFKEFKILDEVSPYKTEAVGPHFGTKEQAEFVAKAKGGKVKKFYLDIKNPIRLKDRNSWSHSGILSQLLEKGIITRAEYDTNVYEKESYDVRKILKDKGYDGIVYANTAEGKGDSYIAFSNSQIKPAPSKGGEQSLIEEAKKYKSAEEFIRANRQSHLMDLSSSEKHWLGRAIPSYPDEPFTDIVQIIKDKGLPGSYLSTMKYSNPVEYKAISSPDDMITVYRAIPENIGDEIRVGDYVALDKKYAQMHLDSVIEGQQGVKGKIISKKVLKKDIVWGEADFTEWAYSPKKLRDKYISLTDIWNKAHPTPAGGKPTLVSKGLTETSQSFDPINETVISGKPEVIKPQIRRQIKRITGITKVGEVIQITDRIALRDKLRLEARAAKKGEVRGRIEQQIKEIEKRKIDSIEQALIDETNDIIKNINRMPTHNMDIGYKDTIEGLKKQFDLKTRSSKTLIRREKLKQFIEHQKLIGQPVNIPIEEIEIAYKKPLNDLMIDELREINSTIKKLSYIGRTKERLTKIRQDKNFQGVKSELIDSMHIKPMSESAVEIVRKTSPLEKMKGGKNTYLYSTIRPERLIEKLDGYQPFGPFWKTMYDPIDRSTNEEITNFNAKRNQFLQFVTDNDIDLVGLLDRQQEIIPKELYLTGQTKIGIYLASHDEGQMRHLMQGGIDIDGKIFDFTPTMLRAAIQSLTPGEKAVGDYLLNHYEEQYSGIDKVYTELYGEHLPKIEGYSPIRISGEEKIFEESLADEMLRRARMRRLGVEKGFTKERTKGASQAVKLDAIDGFLFNLQRVEHFKAFALTIQDIRKVLYDEDIRSAIYSKRGKEFYKRLDNWVKDAANKTEGKNFSPLSKQFSILRSNSAISVLGWNLITAMKQPLSLSIAIAEAGLIPVLSGMAQVTLHPKKVSEFVNERDPQIKYRRVERDIREMIEQQGIVKTLKGAAGPKSLKFLMAMDRRTVLAIWKGAYDQELKKTNDEKLAIRRASQVIRKTQPQSYTKDLAEYFRGGELERMFTMFQNQVNQNVNYWEHDMFGKLLTKGTGVGPAGFAIKWWWSYLLPAYLIGMVSRGRKPTQEELKVDLATYAIMGLPFFGPLISAGLRGYGGVSLPLQVIEYGTDLIKAKKLATKLNILIKAGFAVKGIPYTQPMRVIKGLAEFDEYGVKGLVYGPRKEKKKKKTIMDLLS